MNTLQSQKNPMAKWKIENILGFWTYLMINENIFNIYTQNEWKINTQTSIHRIDSIIKMNLRFKTKITFKTKKKDEKLFSNLLSLSFNQSNNNKYSTLQCSNYQLWTQQKKKLCPIFKFRRNSFSKQQQQQKTTT